MPLKGPYIMAPITTKSLTGYSKEDWTDSKKKKMKSKPLCLSMKISGELITINSPYQLSKFLNQITT